MVFEFGLQGATTNAHPTMSQCKYITSVLQETAYSLPNFLLVKELFTSASSGA